MNTALLLTEILSLGRGKKTKGDGLNLKNSSLSFQIGSWGHEADFIFAKDL